MRKALKLPETAHGQRIVACTIGEVYGGDLLVTPDAASELVQAGVIHTTSILGHFRLIDDMDELLWKYLRHR